jgi:hypothetical protein
MKAALSVPNNTTTLSIRKKIPVLPIRVGFELEAPVSRIGILD